MNQGSVFLNKMQFDMLNDKKRGFALSTVSALQLFWFPFSIITLFVYRGLKRC